MSAHTCKNPDRPGCLSPAVFGASMCRRCMIETSSKRRAPRALVTPIVRTPTPAPAPIVEVELVPPPPAPVIETESVQVSPTWRAVLEIEIRGRAHRWRAGPDREQWSRAFTSRAACVASATLVLRDHDAARKADAPPTYAGMILHAACTLPGRWTLPDLAVAAWREFPVVFTLGTHPHPDSNKVASKLYGSTGLIGKGLVEQVEPGFFAVTSKGLQRAKGRAA